MAAGLDLAQLGDWMIADDNVEVISEIGRGGFSVVFRGKLKDTDKEVAIKKIDVPKHDAELVRFLQREIELQTQINHPSIVQFIGLVEVDGDGLWLVSEYVPNRNLRKWLKAKDLKLPWKLRVRFALDVAQAMVYLHDKSLLHRDLKSTNLMMDANFHLKLADFGFARQQSQDALDRPMTLCGTDDWMAPEVTLGMNYDSAADVFSFGIILVEIITRLRPSHERLRRTPMNAFCLPEENVRDLADDGCPAEFLDLAFACCAYEPSDRPDFHAIVSTLNTIFRATDAEEGWAKPSIALPPSVFTPSKRTVSPILSVAVRRASMTPVEAAALESARAAAVANKGSSPSPTAPPRNAPVAPPRASLQTPTSSANLSANLSADHDPDSDNEEPDLTPEDLKSMNLIS